jgi:APA family basic amino acid/polyamine antiporter
LAIIVLWWSGLAELLGYVGFTLSISTAATVVGLMRLRRREGAQRVPVFGYPLVPLVFVSVTLAAAAIMVERRPDEAAWGMATVVAGIPIYYLLRGTSRRSGSPG